jgi:K+-transporting ATPase ATPase B chain
MRVAILCGKETPAGVRRPWILWPPRAAGRTGMMDATRVTAAGREARLQVKARGHADLRRGCESSALSCARRLSSALIRDLLKGRAIRDGDRCSPDAHPTRSLPFTQAFVDAGYPMTAAAIAAESGIDDFLAQATPEDKLLIRNEQANGKLVAMCDDGTNDAPVLAQADCGVAMQTGTQAAREAGNMIDLDSDPTS